MASKFLRALIEHGNLSEWTAHGNLVPLFKGDELDLAEFFGDFVAKYGKFPTVETFKLETGEELPLATDPPGYYRDKLKERHREMEVKRVMIDVGAMAKAGANGWSIEAWKFMREAWIALNQLEHSAHMIDLRDAESLVMTAYVAKQNGLDPGLTLGWPTLDDMSGGLRLGDMVSIAGRPAIGKTWTMLHAALAGYVETEKNPESAGSPRLFVSMEMDTLMVAQRTAAILASVPFNYLKNGKLTQGMAGFQYEKVKGMLKVANGYKAPFWIVDGNLSSTAEQVAELAQRLKPDAVFIDAAYLLKHPTERDRFKRVAENADIIKKSVANAVCPVVASWQLNREASKKVKGVKPSDTSEEPSLDDIAYSDAIGQVSSLVLGLYKHPDPAQKAQRLVRILKGRSGEVGEFIINWDHHFMLFNEIVMPKVSEFQIYKSNSHAALADL